MAELHAARHLPEPDREQSSGEEPARFPEHGVLLDVSKAYLDPQERLFLREFRILELTGKSRVAVATHYAISPEQAAMDNKLLETVLTLELGALHVEVPKRVETQNQTYAVVVAHLPITSTEARLKEVTTKLWLAERQYLSLVPFVLLRDSDGAISPQPLPAESPCDDIPAWNRLPAEFGLMLITGVPDADETPASIFEYVFSFDSTSPERLSGRKCVSLAKDVRIATASSWGRPLWFPAAEALRFLKINQFHENFLAAERYWQKLLRRAKQPFEFFDAEPDKTLFPSVKL